MEKCKYFEEDSTAHPYFNGRCTGTKNCERVGCGGDERYCSVNADRKKKAEEEDKYKVTTTIASGKIPTDIMEFMKELAASEKYVISADIWSESQITIRFVPLSKETEDDD